MKKLLIALALILALSLVFVACTKDENDDVADSGSETESVVESGENNTTESGDDDQSDTSDTSEPEDNTPPTNDDGSVNLPKVDF